jgi:hypothetical protein
MIAYASRTGTRKNLDALRAAGWRLLVSARGVLRHEGMPYALDNGAWTAYQKGEPFNETAFWDALVMLGDRADWVVIPDIVAGGYRSLRFSLQWLERLQQCPAPLLLVVQDGMTPDEVRPLLRCGQVAGVFVGGSTEWKLRTMMLWGALCRETRSHLHVGRVNTARRIRLCAAAGANSFDGTSASRYVVTLPLLDAQRRQPDLYAEMA